MFSGNSGHERQDCKVGIAVHENVLDVFLGGKTVDRVLAAAGTLTVASENLLPIFARGAAPSAGRIDHVSLNVKNEFIAGENLRRGRRLECALLGQTKNAAGVAKSREGFVQRQKGRGRAAERLQECPTSKTDPLGICTDLLFCFGIGASDMLGERHRAKLAVGGRIDLDWKRSSKLVLHVVYLASDL